MKISRNNVVSVGSVFNDTRKVMVLSLPETIKEKSTFRAKALRRLLLPLSFQVVREPLPHVKRVYTETIDKNIMSK